MNQNKTLLNRKWNNNFLNKEKNGKKIKNIGITIGIFNFKNNKLKEKMRKKNKILESFFTNNIPSVSSIKQKYSCGFLKIEH